MATPTQAPNPTPTTPSAISIEIQTGSTKTTIAPGQTATVPFHNGEVYVVVHFPYLIQGRAMAQVVRQTGGNWQLEMKNPPTGDTLAFSLRGDGPGDLIIEITQGLGMPPSRFMIRVGAGSPPVERTVTLADNGKMITLHVGQRFLLNLGAGYNWMVDVDNPAVLSRVMNGLVIESAQGIYEAHTPGTATLTATGDPICSQAQPSCAMPSLLFRLQVVVK
ncbi:MAG TPA: hypothetical protein VNK89_09695 [Thermoflexus sp.]|nr:hypothetical protein [Thermoflexus sp.]